MFKGRSERSYLAGENTPGLETVDIHNSRSPSPTERAGQPARSFFYPCSLMLTTVRGLLAPTFRFPRFRADVLRLGGLASVPDSGPGS